MVPYLITIVSYVSLPTKGRLGHCILYFARKILYYVTSWSWPGWHVFLSFRKSRQEKNSQYCLSEGGGGGNATIFPFSTAVKYRSWDSEHVYIGTYESRVTDMQEMHTISLAHSFSFSAELTVYQLSSQFISWAHSLSAELTVYQLSSQFISWAHSLSAELIVYQRAFLYIYFVQHLAKSFRCSLWSKVRYHAFLCKFKTLHLKTRLISKDFLIHFCSMWCTLYIRHLQVRLFFNEVGVHKIIYVLLNILLNKNRNTPFMLPIS